MLFCNQPLSLLAAELVNLVPYLTFSKQIVVSLQSRQQGWMGLLPSFSAFILESPGLLNPVSLKGPFSGHHLRHSDHSDHTQEMISSPWKSCCYWDWSYGLIGCKTRKRALAVRSALTLFCCGANSMHLVEPIKCTLGPRNVKTAGFQTLPPWHLFHEVSINSF